MLYRGWDSSLVRRNGLNSYDTDEGALKPGKGEPSQVHLGVTVGGHLVYLIKLCRCTYKPAGAKTDNPGIRDPISKGGGLSALEGIEQNLHLASLWESWSFLSCLLNYAHSDRSHPGGKTE